MIRRILILLAALQDMVPPFCGAKPGYRSFTGPLPFWPLPESTSAGTKLSRSPTLHDLSQCAGKLPGREQTVYWYDPFSSGEPK